MAGLCVGTSRGRPGTIIAGINPEPAGAGSAAAGIQNRQHRVVGEEPARGKYMLREPLPERLEPPGGAADPVRQCREIEPDAVAGKDL